MGNDGRKKLEIVKVAHCSPPIVLALRLFDARNHAQPVWAGPPSREGEDIARVAPSSAGKDNLRRFNTLSDGLGSGCATALRIFGAVEAHGDV